MKLFFRFFALLPVLPLAAQDFPDSAITLDPAAYREVMGQMQEKAPSAATEPVAAWRTAMNAATPEERAVRLLALLQRLNPGVSMEATPAPYTAALLLHRRALQGESAACAALAETLRKGVTPEGLKLPKDPESAAKLEQKPAF